MLCLLSLKTVYIFVVETVKVVKKVGDQKMNGVSGVTRGFMNGTT